MRQSVFLLYNKDTEFAAEEICKSTFVNKKFFSEDNRLTPKILLDMAKSSVSNSFYVIRGERELLFSNFDFSYTIPEWDKEYLHIWNNDSSIKLLSKESVLKNPEKYTDENLEKGYLSIKNIEKRLDLYPIFDIIFISYDEMYADENYHSLKSRFPRAKRSHGVSGIFEAHKAAGNMASTSMFYVVDADAEIVNTFNFNYIPYSADIRSVHVWHSLNPVNDLEYGYGGVKLFPRDLLLKYSGSPLDFSTTVSGSLKVMPDVSNITRFNTDPFSAWRSGFRECAKLASKSISNQQNLETEYRLEQWTTKGADREFGDFAIMGAIAGKDFGYANKDKPEILGLINNFSWLENQFVSQQ